MSKSECSGLLLAFVAAAYIGCGRNELDDGFPTSGVETGSGGAPSTGGSGGSPGSGAAGAAGKAGSSGSGGVPGTGGRTDGGGTTGSGSGGVTGGGPSGSAGGGGNPGTGGSTAGGIACGQTTCRLGAQACCISIAGGRPTETCVAAGATCSGGPSVGCVGGDCGQGRVCCFSLLGVATSCTSAQQCAGGLSSILCSSDSDCPATRSHCCPVFGVSVCNATACAGGAARPGPGR